MQKLHPAAPFQMLSSSSALLCHITSDADVPGCSVSLRGQINNSADNDFLLLILLLLSSGQKRGVAAMSCLSSTCGPSPLGNSFPA
jgi:hypothetical protein